MERAEAALMQSRSTAVGLTAAARVFFGFKSDNDDKPAPRRTTLST